MLISVCDLFRAGYISTKTYNYLCRGIWKNGDEDKFVVKVDGHAIICVGIDDLFEYYGKDGLLTFRGIGPVSMDELTRAMAVIELKPTESTDDESKHRFNLETDAKVKYVGLRRYMIDNKISVRHLGKISNDKNLYYCIVGNREPCKSTIDAILDATGMTYEECFREK